MLSVGLGKAGERNGTHGMILISSRHGRGPGQDALQEQGNQIDRDDPGQRGGCHLAEFHQPVRPEERDADGRVLVSSAKVKTEANRKLVYRPG